MNPEIETAQLLVKAVKEGKVFSEETVLECLQSLNDSKGHNENPEVTKLWAARFWKGFEKVGFSKLNAMANDNSKLSNTLYEVFGK